MDYYVQVPKDLTKVKTKVLFNLTKRQLICFGSGGLVGCLFYFGTKHILGTTLATSIMVLLMLPFFLFGVYEKDGRPLEKILWSEVGTKQDYEAEYGQKPLGEFVREIVGLDMNAAKATFAQYLDDTCLDSRQIYFVNQIVEYIVHNGMLKDLSVLQESPFTDQGSIVDIFTDLNVWLGIRKTIEQVNANAIAA